MPDPRPLCPGNQEPVFHTPNSLLSNQEIDRFSRQIIIPEIGIKGQNKLRNSHVLVIGAGGLGSPVLLYLAASGIGNITIVDYDRVESSNLSRQVIHSNETLNTLKTESAKKTVESFGFTRVSTINQLLTSTNALEIFTSNPFDVVIDASDNPPTRYLISDACVVTGKPLISASALKWEATLTTFNANPSSPCYRCLYPIPPPPESVATCGDNGVIGGICGVFGSLQAVECVKLICGAGTGYSGRMLLYDGLEGTFRNCKLRGRRDDCKCRTMKDLHGDYVAFCGGGGADDKVITRHLLDSKDRVTALKLSELLKQGSDVVVLDVREEVELGIAKLPGPVENIPWRLFERREQQLVEILKRQLDVYVICRRGNDSQLAVKWIRERIRPAQDRLIVDITGGYESWRRHVDPKFPEY